MKTDHIYPCNMCEKDTTLTENMETDHESKTSGMKGKLFCEISREKLNLFPAHRRKIFFGGKQEEFKLFL